MVELWETVVGGEREEMARGGEGGTEHPTEAGDTSLRWQQHMKVWDICPQVPDANKDGGKTGRALTQGWDLQGDEEWKGVRDSMS